MSVLSSRRWRAIAAGAAAVALVLTGCTSSDRGIDYTPPQQVEGSLPEDTVSQLENAVTAAMTASGSSGAIVGVWVPWSGTWVEGIGTQGGKDGAKVTPDMSFRIGDVTRLMTCDVLYGLADDGKVELTAKLPDYVSGVPDLGNLTLLDLCNGTSGLGSSQGTAMAHWQKTPERRWSPLELAGYGLGAGRSTPHTVYRDSDAAYLLLGLALERASGESASALIQKYVAQPLGLSNTGLPSSAPAKPGENPMNGSYLNNVDGAWQCTEPVDITEMSSSTGFTDSGAVSTIEELGTYIQATAAQGLRTSEKPDRFASPLPVSDKGPSWFQATGGAYMIGSMIGQYGMTPGYLTAAYADPKTGIAVAVVLNNSSAGSNLIRSLGWELAAIASKAPAASGQNAPEFALPFTAEAYHDELQGQAICLAS